MDKRSGVLLKRQSNSTLGKVNLIKEYQSRISLWNEVLWLNVESHVFSFHQLDFIISELSNYSAKKLLFSKWLTPVANLIKPLQAES